MKKIITGGLLAAFALGASAQDWKDAASKLPKYEFGQPRAFLVPLDEALRAGGKDAADRKALEKAMADVVTGDATIEAKRYALRALGPIASADSIVAIAGALKEPKTADAAMWALERITDPAAGKALLDALASADDTHKVAYIAALGWRKEASAADILIKSLGGPEDVAAAAADALARIDAPAACGAIHDARAKAQGKARASLSNALLLCAERATDKAAALAIYGELMADSEAGSIRGAALNGLVKAEPDKALERVVQALTSPDAALARVAAGFVRQLPGDAATKAFAGLLGEAPAQTKIILIEALADRGDPAAREAVLGAFDKGDDAVKMAALKALGRIGNSTDATALILVITSGSADLKRVAQTSLNTLPGDNVNAALLAMVKQNHGDAKMKSAALAALADRRAKETRGELLKMLDQVDASIKGDAYAALGALVDEADLPALFSRLSLGQETTDVPALQRVITAASNRIAAEDKRAAAAAEQLQKAAGTETKVQLIEILGGIPTAQSLDALRAAMKTDEARVRLVAVKTIAAWPNNAPLADLLQIAKSPPSDDERAAALAGYVRLVRESKELSSAEALADYEAALGLATSAAEKKQIVAGLSTVPAKRAIELLEGLKADADLEKDASSGIVSVSRLVSGAFPAYAKEKLTPFAAEGTPEPIKKPATAALGLLGALGDYVTAWEVSGPYLEAGKSGRDLFDMSFAPEKADGGAKWNICPLAYNNPESPDLKPWAVDLGAVYGGQERVAYLRTTLNSAKAQDGVLELGTNDGCKVWFNGKEIFGFKEGRPLIPGQDKLPISLQQGKNSLLIAVYQHGGQWAACARIADKEGKALSDVTASVE